MRLYLDTTILAALTFVISFYSIHELFLLPFDYEDEKTARKIGIVTYDTHFDQISHKIKVFKPDKVPIYQRL